MDLKFNISSMFYNSTPQSLFHYNTTLSQYLKQFPIFKNYKLIETELFVQMDEDREKILAQIYPDRIEFYQNARYPKLLYYILASNTTIILGDSLEMKKINYDFHGFILSNNYQSKTYYVKNQSVLEKIKPFLKQTFIQNMIKFRSNYVLKKLIGTGAYSQIYSAGKWSQISQQYAVKVISKETIRLHDNINQIVNEIICLKLSSFLNFYKLFEIIEGENNLYFITEYFKEGDLFHHLQQTKFKETEALDFFNKIVIQLKALQEHKILHGDIKLENILIKKNGQHLEPALIDFGFSQICLQEEVPFKKLKQLIGTEGYTAPEILTNFKKDKSFIYNEKSESFSLGVVFYSMIYKQFPYENSPEGKLIFPEKSVQISVQTKDLLEKMLKRSQLGRISLNQILQHCIFRNEKTSPNRFKIRKQIQLLKEHQLKDRKLNSQSVVEKDILSFETKKINNSTLRNFYPLNSDSKQLKFNSLKISTQKFLPSTNPYKQLTVPFSPQKSPDRSMKFHCQNPYFKF